MFQRSIDDRCFIISYESTANGVIIETSVANIPRTNDGSKTLNIPSVSAWFPKNCKKSKGNSWKFFDLKYSQNYLYNSLNFPKEKRNINRPFFASVEQNFSSIVTYYISVSKNNVKKKHYEVYIYSSVLIFLSVKICEFRVPSTQ